MDTQTSNRPTRIQSKLRSYPLFLKLTIPTMVFNRLVLPNLDDCCAGMSQLSTTRESMRRSKAELMSLTPTLSQLHQSPGCQYPSLVMHKEVLESVP